MELELGLKITRTREDVSSSVDFRFSKDPFGPLVLSRETDSRFIIIIHIKGFKKEGIEIEINKEGDRITIKGRKPVEQMVMIRWMAWRKEVEFRVFKKVFRIPDTVDLDEIKARFDDDDATLTITMPKRVKGISGFNIEEDQEERVDDKGEVGEEGIEREESEKFETEIQKEEEFGDIMENKERENQVLKGEGKSFSGGLEEEEFGEKESQVLGEQQKEEEEEETDDDNLDKIHENDEEQEEETIVADSNKENENSSLRKLPDIQERDSHEEKRHEEQERVVEQQAETNSNDYGCRAFKEIGEQKPDVTTSREMEKETIDDDDHGLSKFQEIEEPEVHNEESKKVEGETIGQKRKQIVKMDIKNRDAKEEEVDGEMGDGFRPKIDKTHVVAENDVGETETKVEEFESDKLKADEVHKIHELVEKKEDEVENAKLRGKSKDISLIKLQENEEQHSKGQKRQDKPEMIKELVEEKNPKAVQAKTGDKGKEGRKEKKSVKMIKTGDAKEEVDAKMGGGFAANIAETATKFEEFESNDKLDSDEVDKIQKLVEKKEEEELNAKVGTQSEDISSTKLQEIGEQQFQGQKRHEKMRELVEEQTLEAETNIRNDIPKPVLEIKELQEVETLEKTSGEGKARKAKKKSVKMEINNEDVKEEVGEKMGQGFKPNVSETDTKADGFESNKLEADKVDKMHALVEKKQDKEENAELGRQTEDISLKELQEIEEQHLIHGQKRHDKQEKSKELVEEKTLEEETNIGNNNPKPVAEISEGKHNIQKKTNDPGARKVQEIIRQQELDEPARAEKESKTRELVKSKTNDEKKDAETETKEQESYRPKILKELAEEENTNFSENGNVNEEEEIAEKKTEFGGDNDVSRKIVDIKQRNSDATKGQEEEKDMILVMEEKVSDGGKRILAVSETKAENVKSKKVQEIDEQQLHEDDTCGKQFQKLIGGEVSGHGEVEDVENDKKPTEAEKIIRDRRREAQEIKKTGSDVSGKYIKGTMIQENEEPMRGIYRNEHEEEKRGDSPENITGTMEHESVNLNSQLDQDNLEYGEETEEVVKEKFKDCEEEEEGSEESKTKADDNVVRKVQGINEQESYGPKREHVSKIQELVEEKTGDHEKEQEKKIAESEIEAECDSLRKVDGSKSQELHEPKIHKGRYKTRITGVEEPSCQEDEKIVESTTIGGGENCDEKEELHGPKLHKECDKTQKPEAEEPSGEEEKKIVEPLTIRENDNSVHVQEINKEQPDKLESQAKPYKIQEVVEGLNDYKEEDQKEKAELETERESSKKVEETEQQKYDGPRMQNTEEKNKIISVEEKEIVEKRTKTKDGSLTKVRDDEDQESSKPYKRQTEDKTQELMEMGTSDYREKVKKQDEKDILRSQEEFERHGGDQSNVPQLVEEEKVENIGGKIMDDDSSCNFHEFDEGKSYEDWTHEEQEKRNYLVKEEATDLKDKHISGEDQHQEKIIVERRKKTREMEENEIVERRKKTKDESLRKVQDPELGKHGEEDMIQELAETEINDHRGKVKKKDIVRSQETGKLDLSELERHCKQRKINKSVKDEHTGGGEGEHEEERYEKAKNFFEDGINKKVGQNKEPEPEKHELYDKLDKSEGVLKQQVSDQEKEEENFVDELEMHEKQDMVPDFVKDETGDQKDEEAEEAAAVVASNANGSSRMVQTIEEESEVDKEKNKIPELSDLEVKGTKEEVPKSRNVRDTKEIEAHERKTENCKEEKGKQGKVVETMSREKFNSTSDDGIVRKIQETKVQESNEKKNQEQKGKIEETKRRESTSHEVNLVAEDDSLRKGQEFLEKESKRGPGKQEKFQQLKKLKAHAHVNEDEEQAEAETKINYTKSSMNKKPMEEESNVPEKEKEANEKFAEERMQDKTDNRIKNQEIKGEEPYEFLRNGEHGKIPEYHREEQREIEEMKRSAGECSSRKVQKNKAQESDELQKHWKLSEIQESSNVQESVEEEAQKYREEEPHESVLKKKSSESQDVEEKGSDQPKRYAEQELRTEEERKEGEQKEKAKRVSQVDSKANDDSTKTIETKVHELTGLQGQKKKENHQDLDERETIDQRKEEIEEHVVGKAETIDEYENSRKIQEHEKRKSDKLLERHGEEDMSKKLAEQGTSDDKETKEGKRATEAWEEVETKIRADGFGNVREIEEQEKDKKQSYVGKDKKQSYVEKDIGGKSKEYKNQETKRRDDSSGNKTHANEKQESYEQKRNEEVVEKQDTIEKHDSSRKIHDKRKSDTMSENIAEEETSDDKEAKERNRAGVVVLGVVEQDKKKSFVDTSGKAKENKNQETKRRDDSAESKTQKQEYHKKKTHDEQDKKNLGLLGKETNCCRNEEDVKEDKENAETEVTRKLKGIEKRESTKMVERHENGDDSKELVEEKMNNKEGEDKESIVTDVLAKAEDHETKGPEGLRKQDKNSEQRLRDNHKDKETSKTETKKKDNESRKIHQIKEEETNEQERLKEQGRIKELVEDRTHSGRENKETEFEDSKKIQERDKEESIEAGRNEKRDKIQEPVDRETSEELEIEFEDEEEDWEAEVIQETDSDEDNDKIRQIKRIRLGFRLVGGSTLFMSLIVIVISFIRSKRKIRCYKF